MTRQDLVNKSIDKLNTVKEALELIEILEYDECIAVLTGTKNLPSEIHSALMRRGKEANGGKTTLEEYLELIDGNEIKAMFIQGENKGMMSFPNNSILKDGKVKGGRP